MMPRSRRAWVFTIVSTVFGLVLGCVLGAIGLTLAERGPPVQVLAQADAGTIAAHDGRLFLYYRVRRERDCTVETGRWLFTYVDHDGESVRAMVPMDAGSRTPATGVGMTSFVLALPLPSGLWPGRWWFQTDTIDYCGGLGWLAPTRRESEPVQVDIELARAAADLPVIDEKTGKIRGRSPVAR